MVSGNAMVMQLICGMTKYITGGGLSGLTGAIVDITGR